MKASLSLGIFCMMTTALNLSDAALDPAVAKPPSAARKSKTVGLHGDKLDDPWFWLREKENPEVLAYLKAENAYAASVMAPFQKLEDSLYREMLGRIKQTDISAPFLQRGYWLYHRTEEGKQYPIFCRKKGTIDAPEEIVLDVNQLAQGRKFMAVHSFEYSDDNAMLAYSTDVDGHRDYDFHLKKLATDEELKTPVGKVAELVWATDSRTIFYVTENKAKRSYRLWRYTLGEKTPTMLYEERDELFNLELSRSRDRKFIFCVSESSRTTEARFARADEAKGDWHLLAPRRNEVRYYPEHRDGLFYIRTNDGAKEFRVVTAPVTTPGFERWREFIPAQPGITIKDFQPFARHAVITVRQEGLIHYRVLDFATNESQEIALPEPAYLVSEDENPEFDTGIFRFAYESPVTPQSVFAYDVASHARKLLKQTEVGGGYDSSQYLVERVQATAADGTGIPLDVIRKKSIALDGQAPGWLYGYGSYGISIDASFSSNRISLLDRGLIYAIAHVRGGGELGEAWHDSGRMLTKRNTFSDFVACADYLVNNKYTSHDRMVIQGGSAGGLLIGATLNLRPDVARAAILDVPFVDVLNTMSDPTLPLTTEEYIEWGNPNRKTEYKYIKSYSPYDNITARDYPAMMLFTSLNDSQVPYWEPAKFAAKMRATKTDKNALIFKTNLEAGHGGSSGRFDRLREVAAEYAFGLAVLDLAKVEH
jgi:oligopeptidase B